MRPGVTAYDIGAPGRANYDEAKANPYPNLPPLLVMKDGTKVTTPAQWKKRREEIKAMFDEYVYGKYPAHIPGVTWKVDSVEEMNVQGVPAIVKHVVNDTDIHGPPLRWIFILTFCYSGQHQRKESAGDYWRRYGATD